jgi:hypothetical protein
MAQSGTCNFRARRRDGPDGSRAARRKDYRPTGPELLGAEEMAQAIGRAVGRSVRPAPTPVRLFMKTARMSGYPIDLFNNIHYYIEDHKRGAAPSSLGRRPRRCWM